MTAALPNPISPPPGTFLSRLRHTRKCLNALDGWVPPIGRSKEDDSGSPFVSVMLITYNHEQYIRQAIDSVLMQVRDFTIEINIVDDASTDGTQAIAKEYSERFPDIFNCYFNPINAGRVATQLNTIRGFRTLRGRYFVLLEGDDYWTDPHKLQKQIDFLEANIDFVACAHQTLKVFDDDSRPPEHFLPYKAFNRNTAELYDLISMAGVYHLSSIVYRNVFEQSPPACLYDDVSCEVTINMLYGTFGKFYCFDEYMSVYRVHGGGVFSVRPPETIWLFHLHGFRRFALYLGPRHWSKFARATLGFTGYVLRSPLTGKEVTSLRPSSWILFLSHWLIAAFVCLFSADSLRALLRLPFRTVVLAAQGLKVHFPWPKSIFGFPRRARDHLFHRIHAIEARHPQLRSLRHRIMYGRPPTNRKP